ncbi:nidogen-2-like [Actinia tenebrosa]|uniref:Nidogen-2-like n=1 Tax=Actinia tenebrosa TaxID=6105 RepID=A0A6P8IT82_ACTTE|nr:nidogen-2-like [Actinia tenebrosa]
MSQNPCEGKPCLNKGKCLLHKNRRDYRCRCKKGYTGEKCQHDIDECTTASPCHVNATCINIPGSYACRCNDGFSGDGFSCADIDECATNVHQCDRNAYCNNTVGSYRCTCNRGYYGNGIKCTTSRGLDFSAILSNYGNADYIRTLSGYLDPVLQSSSRSRWIRCWHAATDGWNTATIFHPQCDGKGPTVTIVRVGSYVFGGYTDVSWHSRWQYFSSSRSFLYSLYNTNGYSPVKLTLNGRDGNQHAIYGGSSYGPTFGRGHDLVISNYASNTTSSHTYMGFSYYAPPGCRNGGYECSTLAGTYGFTPNDIEVFYETTS